MSHIPALLGGTPVRSQPFVVGPMIDGEEERLVLEAIRKNNFSRYIGSLAATDRHWLTATSHEAREITADWHFLGGENVRLFAAEFAEKFDVDFAIPINSATSGLSVALAAAGIGQGDEVIVPALSFTATGSAILLFNSVPVFVDVDPVSYCLDPACVEAAITPRTKAILVVHLLGNAADMDAIMAIAERHNLKVIEDCAQAPGTRHRGRMVGTIGDAGVFSFQQSKNIMTGEGGMIITRHADLARRARLILNHGETVMEPDDSDADLVNIVGLNMRMPELCAAVGRAQLAKLDTVNDLRNRNHAALVDGLAGLPGLSAPVFAPEVEPMVHLSGFLYDEAAGGISREVLVAALRAEGIPVGTGYVRLMPENPTFQRKIAVGTGGCPWSCSGSVVSYDVAQYPVAKALIGQKFVWLYHIAYPNTLSDIGDVVAAMKKVFNARQDLAAQAGSVSSAGARAQGRIL